MEREHKILYAISFGAVLLVLVLMGICSLVLPKPTESVIERRRLAEKPDFTAEALLDGSYTEGMDLYYSDTFPGREKLVSLASFLKEHLGLRGEDDTRLHTPTTGGEGGGAQSQPQASSQPEQDLPEDAASSSSQPEDPGTINTVNALLINKGRAMQVFGGTEASAQAYAKILNGYLEALGDEVQIYNLVVPTSTEFYLPEKYRSMTRSESENIQQIYAALDPRIKTVDAVSLLRQHTDEYLYFRTDHHWTGLAAYYAFTRFAEAAGFEPQPLEAFTARRLENFLGSLYSQTQDSSLAENPDYVEYYLLPNQYEAWRYLPDAPFTPFATTLHGEYAQGVNSYSVFLHGDFPLIQVKTDQNHGRKILVVKESYGNAFAPFLATYYDEVHIVDQRYFQLNLVDYIRQHEIHEVLFLNNVFAANTPYHQQCIANLRFQHYVPPAEEPEEEEPVPGQSGEETPAGMSAAGDQPAEEESQPEEGEDALEPPPDPEEEESA